MFIFLPFLSEVKFADKRHLDLKAMQCFPDPADRFLKLSNDPVFLFLPEKFGFIPLLNTYY